MFRGFATISYWADDLKAARAWYSDLLGVAPYFERPDAENPAYIEYRIGDYQDELGIIDRRYAPYGAGEPARRALSCTGTSTMWTPPWNGCCPWGATVLEPRTDAARRGGSPPPWSIPFGNILGVMYNPHYLEVLNATRNP